MASVLSFPHFTPFGGFDYDRQPHRSLSSLRSCNSTGTIRHHRKRQLSIGSVISGASRLPVSVRRLHKEKSSRPHISLTHSLNLTADDRSISSGFSATQSLAPSALSEPAAQALRYEEALRFGADDRETIDAPADNRVSISSDEKDTDSTAEQWYEPSENPSHNAPRGTGGDRNMAPSDQNQEQAFRRWVSTLRRRNDKSHTSNQPPSLRRSLQFLDPSRGSSYREDPRTGHRHSGSQVSSIAFVTGLRSASMTMTSMSLPSIKAPTSARSPRSVVHITSDPNSRTDLRKSTDSDARPRSPVIDEAAIRRSQRRARKIQELVRTEEGYVADIKSLQHAYFTLLLPGETGLSGKRAAAQACVNDMLHLHEGILAELQACLQHLQGCETARLSLETARPMEVDPIEHLCAPQLAADVARIFLTRAKQLSVYEEYGARCGKMHLDVDLHRTGPPTLDHDRAIEALQASLLPLTGKLKDMKKALGLKDLLVKPIQRVTRYELLFKDLCTLTPSCDDPVAHTVLDDALFIISQTCHDVNEASGNMERLRFMDGRRLLQQRLLFEKQACNETSFHQLGRLLLCGALYIAYRGNTNIKGQYVVCALYESCMIVADAKSSTKYNVLLVAPLATASIEEPDNGKALQCHTTPFTWKLTFESEGSLFEILCAACSKTEFDAWKHQISGRIAVEKVHSNEGHGLSIEVRSPMTHDMRSVGKAYGRPCHFRRRVSVQRAATLGPLTELNQVIIKNTQAIGKDNDSSTTTLSIPRSQSVTAPSHIPVLAPRRSDRIHLEAILLDVWTRESLPFPGLGSKRGEYSMRASAGHVIRKLSMASITSNFSKRSTSYTSISQASSIDDRSLRSRPKVTVPQDVANKPVGKKIDFHSHPEAFLPEDFDLKNPAKARGRLAGLRTLTMGMERPRAPFFATESTVPSIGVKRSRSVVTRRRSLADIATQIEAPPPPPLPKDTVNTGAQYITTREIDHGGPSERSGVRQRARSRLAKLMR
ncbi:Dynamin-binding protein [Sphaceloma murrayae]|uniref:Dynamin-binding protein n=1 Tax=Sphaceloma murrayae TaxID=2082308 RepID=A0A2K1QQS3_9PEZI|nr:Dynamin-binding protein [Sphaceloma murrayae]